MGGSNPLASTSILEDAQPSEIATRFKLVHGLLVAPEGGYPADAFHYSWEKLTKERRPYPGPTFVYDGEGDLRQAWDVGP